MKRSSLAFVAGLLLAGAADARPAPTPEPVVAAERAFAADGVALGVRDSFLKHAAPEGLVFAPEPTLARAAFQNAPGKDGPPLVWWPLWAGIAKSGDLGFTTGPYTSGGQPGGWYFTVWARQADGGWKWLMDAGPPSSAEGAAPQGSPVTYVRPAERGSGSAAKAMTEVGKAEAALHAAAASDAPGAFLAVASEDARMVGSRAAPPTDRVALVTELATRPKAIRFTPLGGQASSAGDLAWTYGVAAWTRDGAERRGHYVRIWRQDRTGWRLLFDELLPAPPLKTPPVTPPPAPPAS